MTVKGCGTKWIKKEKYNPGRGSSTEEIWRHETMAKSKQIVSPKQPEGRGTRGKDLTQGTDKAIGGVQWFLRGIALGPAIFNICQAPTVYRGLSNLVQPGRIERKTTSTLNNTHPLYTRHSLNAHCIPVKLLSSFFSQLNSVLTVNMQRKLSLSQFDKQGN